MCLKNSLLRFLLVSFAIVIAMPAASQEQPLPSPKRNDFKITLLSLGSGSSRFTYERAFSPRNSAEVTLGIVGLGWDWMNRSDPKGVLVKMAYKWNLIPCHTEQNWLEGFYVKPELVFASFLYSLRNNPGEEPSKCPENTMQVALLAECGYQILFDWFVFDIYTGLGPSIGTGNRNNYYHSFMLFPHDGWLAFTSGFRIGIAF